MAGYGDFQDEDEYVTAVENVLAKMTPSPKIKMLRALETIMQQDGPTELRRLAMQRYLEITEKDKSE